MNKIIAVVGMCGSGKTEAVKYFEENGWKKVYFGDVVMEEMKKDSMEINEKNERQTREELRAEFGMGVMAIKSIDKIRKYFSENNVVIESLYSWEEFKIVKDEFGDAFSLLALYTTKDIRYSRLSCRTFRPLTREEAESRDMSEIEKLDKGGPIAFADNTIINDSDLDTLKSELRNFLK